jgi:hypothetical protein
VYLRTNLTFAELARGNGVDKSTMCRNIHEGINTTVRLWHRVIHLSLYVIIGAGSANPGNRADCHGVELPSAGPQFDR